MHRMVSGQISCDTLGTCIFRCTDTGILCADTSWQLWNSGEWWMFLAAQSMAAGTVILRIASKYTDPVMATGYHMLLGGIPLMLLSIYIEHDQLFQRLGHLTGPSRSAYY